MWKRLFFCILPKCCEDGGVASPLEDPKKPIKIIILKYLFKFIFIVELSSAKGDEFSGLPELNSIGERIVLL